MAIMKAAKDTNTSFISDILKSTWKTYINDLNFNLTSLVWWKKNVMSDIPVQPVHGKSFSSKNSAALFWL